MAMRLKVLLGLLAALIAGPVLAQSTATPTVPGQLTGVGCAPGYGTCFVPSTPATPLEVISTTFSAGSSTTLSAGTTTSNVALASNGAITEVANGGSVTAYLNLGVGTGTTAKLTSYPLPAGWTVFLYTGSATYLAGITGSSTATLTITSGNLIPLSSGGGGPTSNVNVAQVNGVTVLTGSGATGSGSQRVTVAVDSATVAGSASLPAGTNTIGAVLPIPTAVSTNAIAPVVSASAEGTHVFKGSAGNLYSAYVTTGATAGFLMIFNATSAPVDGAVTPIHCVGVAANSSVGINFTGPPESYATGISAAFSSTGCFVKTASATAFFHGSVQ